MGMAHSALCQGKCHNLGQSFYNFFRFEWQKVFHQLYTLSGEILDKVFGSVYCLLEKKDKNIYCKIFSFIMHWADQHGYTLTIRNEKGRLRTDLGSY